MRVYRVCPTLDISRDVKANSSEEDRSLSYLVSYYQSVNPTPRYREDLAKQELRSDGVVCDTHKRVWVGVGDIIDWPQKSIDERHPESDDYGYVDVEGETYNIVIAVNGVDTYFRTIDLER